MGDDAAIAECAAYPLDVGDYRRPDIATRFPETGEWFHRGINWMFTFHHEESMRCFRKALALEPDFAMAHWGIAVCNCPNYNVHEKNGWFELSLQEEGFPSQKTAFEAAAQAVRFKGNANPAGRALIEAMQIRCVWPANDFARMLQRPYAEALRTVYLDYPEDPDVACIFAEALMQLTPWALFDAHDKTTAKHTPEIALILRTAIAQHPRHPGLLHLFIHLMEMSPTPADALPMADTLRSLSPDCGHLKHMPSHIDVLVGNYQAGSRANELALAANARYEVMARREGLEFSMFIGYHAHDFHMYIYCAMLAGMEQAARAKAEELRVYVREAVARYPARAADLDLYHAVHLHVLVRFGRWEEILELPRSEAEAAPILEADPELDVDVDIDVIAETNAGAGAGAGAGTKAGAPTDTEAVAEAEADRYCGTRATMHYVRGLALAALGRVAEAQAESAALEVLRREEPVRQRILHNNKAEHLLAVNAEMLKGEIRYRNGNFDDAFMHLREAVRLQDRLNYDEPPGQMQSVRHALGALLLEQGVVVEAEFELRKNLEHQPRNIWALTGLLETMRKTLPPDHKDLAQVAADIAHVSQFADFNVQDPCACAGLAIANTNSA